MEYQQRYDKGEVLKSHFNLLFDQAHNKESGLAYRDMQRIADAMRYEGPKVLGLKALPPHIEAGLYYAISAVSPDKARTKENMKKAMCTFGGSGGLALAAICLGQLVNPGVWAIVVTFFVGGFAGGPLAVIGIAAGISTVAIAVYKAFSKMSPGERARKAHSYVMKSIDRWVKKGSGDIEEVDYSTNTTQQFCHVNNRSAADTLESDEKENLAADYLKEAELFSSQISMTELTAINTLMYEMAMVDGNMNEKELDVINEVFKNNDLEPLSVTDSIKILSQSSKDVKVEALSWILNVAVSHGGISKDEERLMRIICKPLGVSYDSLLDLHKK